MVPVPSAQIRHTVLLLGLVLLAWPQAAVAVLCSVTSKDVRSRLPRGWREAIRNVREFLACPDEETAEPKRQELEEDFLQGLDFPASYWRVELTKMQVTEKIGFDISRKTDYFEVGKVQENGPLPRWNGEKPSKAVQRGDRIIEVNRVVGNSTKMVEEMRRSVNVTLKVLRLSLEDRRVVDQKRSARELNKVLRIGPPPGLGRGIPEPADSKVVSLHARNIDEYLAKQPVTVLMVYAHWCGHCRELAPEYTRSAELVEKMSLQQSVRFAKFDHGDEANRENDIGDSSRLNITSYPAFFLFNGGKHEPFYGLHSADEIAAYVGAKARGEDPEGAIKRVLFKMRPMMYRGDTADDKVLDLEPENFEEMVLSNPAENNRVWIIEYYSDKCPFCRSLKPEYIKASEEVKRKLGSSVKLAAVNSRAFHDLAELFGVTSYPWIISVYAGRKGEDMTGLGGAESIVRFATEQHEKLWKKSPDWAKELPKMPESSSSAQTREEQLPDNSTGTWRELLGRRTWFFLHTLAAKYPEDPTEADQASVKALVASLGQHYPCPICRQHLQGKLVDPALGPVPTSSRTDLTKWFCQLHNMVNSDLGKPQFSCNAFELDLKYLKSCGECTVSKSVDSDAEQVSSSAWNYFKYLEATASKVKEEL